MSPTPEALEVSFPFVIVALLLAIFGIILGFQIGDEIGSRVEVKKQFWLYNFYIYLCVIVACAVFLGFNLLLFIAFCLGFLAGAVAGLRMGYGQSTGPWVLHDRFYQRNRSKVADRKNPKSEVNHAPKGKRGRKVAAQELMSVEHMEGHDALDKSSGE